jgi:hypothetical protein
MTDSMIDNHISKLRPESKTIAGGTHKGLSVPAAHHPMFIASADIWSVAHLPSDRFLLRGGLTQRQAFEQAMRLYNDGRDAGLNMHDSLPEQLARLTPYDLEQMSPAARAYVATLRELLADAQVP